MLIGLLLGSNIFIAISYFLIGGLILRALLQGQQHLLKNPLVLATVGIFLSCGLGHSGHVMLMAIGADHSNPLLLSIQVGFDLMTAMMAGIYIALRHNYSFLVEGPVLLAKTQTQLSTANTELASINTHLETLVTDRTAELLQINQQLESEISDRKQVEAALRQSELRFRQLAENIDEVFWMVDLQTDQILYVSPTYEKIWGVSCESLYQSRNNYLETIHPEDRDRMVVAFEKHLDGDYDEEYRIVQPNGSVRWIHDRSYPLKDQEGNIYRLIGIAEDISKRKQTETDLQRQMRQSQMVAEITLKLRQSLQLEEILQTTVTEVREFLETDRVIIYQFLTDGSGIVVNEAVIPEQPVILQQNITDQCFPESYLEMYRQGRVRAIDDLEKSDLNHCHIAMLQKFAVKANLVVPILQGENLWGLLIAHECEHPRHWTQFECELLQQIANQVGIALSQAQFLAAVRESENKYRSVVNNVKEVIFQIDANGFWTFLNSAWTEITGYLVEASIGKYFLNSIHPCDRSVVLATSFGKLNAELNLNSSSEHRQSDCRQEIRFLTSTGSVRWLDVHAQLTSTPDGKMIGASGTLNDITERKRAEAEIRKALKQEQELSELKSRFVTMTSHEFRTPLSTILSSAELLEAYRHNFSQEKQLKHLHRIQGAVQHMTQMLNDVLVIGKADAGKLEFNPASLDLAEFCNALVEDMQISSGSLHTITFQHRGQCYATGMDEKLLRHIFTNLLANAIKYSAPGSLIQFELICDGDEAIFILQDAGIGIPLEDQKGLFGSFYRATNVGTIPGTGLGLAVVKKCIDLHGGKVAVSSKVGEGTIFTVTLPLNPWRLTDDQNFSY